ncbi:hypothetical protein JQC91_13180 [Jannaschia sp. Os4]|uniref:hypothetical protein n=1 Tax=Jannaschia sp. Os4 TaxID=2807617 RepID=UPI00193A32BE|nr:hypothetical protein [Jannaschia sp. Os4]MBM2577255.1 hypothetical protein [Jannaschia sp. Os4]
MGLADITLEDQVFADDGDLAVGGIRLIRPDHLIAWFEGHGEEELRPANIEWARHGKVRVDPETLSPELRMHLESARNGEIRKVAQMTEPLPGPEMDPTPVPDAGQAAVPL